MKYPINNTVLFIGILAVTAVSLYANDPMEIPWQVGSTLGEMNQTKTLMNSYGDPNGKKFEPIVEVVTESE